ncbi:MAG: HlyD family efflux transporter periplasmic adaptor subunit [Caldilineae bacterium]|nr:MAG: HlyD family efflux transporter periplasmic adaptor subunit [Caldilineae bacterium]
MIWANLSTSVGGTVAHIHVSEGDWVKEGEVLIELENEVLKSQVEQAKAALAQARANRDKLLAGATEAEIAAARAEVAAAEAAVALAEGRLEEVQAAIESAEAQLNIAQQQYNELASHPTPAERKAAEAEVAIAQAAVNQAQANYNRVRGDPNIASRPEALALQQATEALKAAQAKYELAIQGPTPQQLAVAQAEIRAAQAQVTVAKSQLPAAQANVDAAKARLDSAKAALDRLLSGPTEEDIAIADAEVRAAIAALASAHANLRETQVIAPFEGQVGAIHVRVGELAVAGQPMVLLGDTRQMHVKTTDLRETDVVRLQPGMNVEVTFDALPDRVFQGTITRIAPVSTTEKGSTNFTVTIEAPEWDESLRWGMTAFVNIEVK